MIAGHKKHIIGEETISSRDSSVKLNFSERASEREIHILLVCDFSFSPHFFYYVAHSGELLNVTFERRRRKLMLKKFAKKIEI
jgi:hypothetical protein